MYRIITSTYRLFRVWSLDVVIGTLSVGMFVVKLFDVTPSPWWWIILAMAVWVIYTADHLLDGFKGRNTNPVIYRHQYHFKHNKVLFAVVIVLSLFTFWAGLSYLHTWIVYRGVFLFGAIIIYFLLVHFIQKRSYFFNQKEFFIALAYVAGIALAPYIWKNSDLSALQMLLLVSMVFIAWAEGVLASWFDYTSDLHDGHASFTTTFGKQNTRYFLIALHIFIFILLKVSIFFVINRIQFSAIIIEALMNLGLLLMLMFPSVMEKYERYRILGEMIFWLPGIIWFVR